MVRVVTIDREYGSGASEIAQKLAERLRWKLWDQRLTAEIARLLECDSRVVQEREERCDPLRRRLLKAFWRGSFEGADDSERFRTADADCIREAAETVVRQAAWEGQCVIVGRGSAYYLQDDPGAFHVFIYAPIEYKVERLKAQGHSEDEAYRLAETVDGDRSAYIKKYFQADWPAARHFYHLMLNSAVGEDVVVDTIMDWINRKNAAG
ncbi:MAG TPA: cytidylate kinase-like family protein [Bryobacteraceae bacterium]|nr:cytidylate kinase-like family protein [Bryobacteraceae bacterium]